MKTSLLQYSLGIFACAVLSTSVATGQGTPAPAPPSSGGGGGGAAGGGAAGGGAGGNIPRTPSPTPSPFPSNSPTQQRSPFPDTPRPMFLSGKVMLDDGTPPPEPIMIDRVCSGVIHHEGYTDSKGRFSFQLGQNNSIFMDASVSDPSFNGTGGSQTTGPVGGIRERDLFSCELRANMPGYRSDIVSLANRKFMDNPEVGTLVLHRLGNVEGLTISATTREAPKDARKELEKGRNALKKEKLEEAQNHLEKAVEIYPKYAVAWCELGYVQDRQKKYADAHKSFDASIAADAKYVSPYEGLAQLAARENNWKDVADITDRIIHLNPVDFPRAYFFNAVAKFNLKQLDGAQKSVTDLITMDDQHHFPRAEQLLGLVLAQKDDYKGAAVHLRKFIEIQKEGAEVDQAKKQLAELEKSQASREPAPKE